MDKIQFPKLDRTAFSVVSSFEEADKQDRDYWLSRTPYERLQYMELLRRINYGSVAATRLQRVLELLKEHDVRYLLIGGYAVGYHGYSSYTENLDI